MFSVTYLHGLILQISLPDECFLFDIRIIGARGALESGLKDVLENPNVKKVGIIVPFLTECTCEEQS